MKKKPLDLLRYADADTAERIAAHIPTDKQKMERILQRSEEKLRARRDLPQTAAEQEVYHVQEAKPRPHFGVWVSLAACAAIAAAVGTVLYTRQNRLPVTAPEMQPMAELTSAEPETEEATAAPETKPVPSVTLSAEKLTAGSCVLVVTVAEDAKYAYFCGSEYSLQRLTDGAWEALPYVTGETIGWNSVAYALSEGENRYAISWEWLYGRLPAGTYRICKGITEETEYGTILGDTPYYAEFEITPELVAQEPPEEIDLTSYQEVLNRFNQEHRTSWKIVSRETAERDGQSYEALIADIVSRTPEEYYAYLQSLYDADPETYRYEMPYFDPEDESITATFYGGFDHPDAALTLTDAQWAELLDLINTHYWDTLTAGSTEISEDCFHVSSASHRLSVDTANGIARWWYWDEPTDRWTYFRTWPELDEFVVSLAR